MPIADFHEKRSTILFDGGEFSVRALTLSDVVQVIEIHEDAVNEIYAKMEAIQPRGESEDPDTVGVIAFLIQGLRESPALVARVIALASDEYDQAPTILRMPVSVQTEALKQIGILTFGDIDGGKKFFADVIELIRGMRATGINTPAIAA